METKLTDPETIFIPEHGPDEQLRKAFRSENRVAAAIGLLLGGIIPLSGFVIWHDEHPAVIATKAQFGDFVHILTVIGVACLAFSAQKVYGWAKTFLGNGSALFFVVVLEGVMLAIKAEWLAYACLGILIGINAVATSYKLATHRERRDEAIANKAEAEKAIERAQKAREKAQKDAEKAAEKERRRLQREAAKARKEEEARKEAKPAIGPRPELKVVRIRTPYARVNDASGTHRVA